MENRTKELYLNIWIESIHLFPGLLANKIRIPYELELPIYLSIFSSGMNPYFLGQVLRKHPSR